MVSTITVPAQASQAEAVSAVAAALAQALGKPLDSTGAKVLVEGEMGFKVIPNSSTKIAIVISAGSFSSTLASVAVVFSADIVVDYIKTADSIAVGLRASASAAPALFLVFAKTESGDKVLIHIQAGNSMQFLCEGWTALKTVDGFSNATAESYITLMKMPSIFFKSLFANLFTVACAPNVGTNVEFTANGKTYQLLCAGATYCRLAMKLD